MIRFAVAMAIGAIIAVGGIFILESALSSAANGSPTSYSLYQYGNR
jgi:hypothetical protein